MEFKKEIPIVAVPRGAECGKRLQKLSSARNKNNKRRKKIK